MIKYVFGVIVLVILISCEKEIKMDMPDKERKMVVNAELQDDSLVRISISNSIGILEQDKLAAYITDATVKLYEDDVYVGLLQHTDTGTYASTIKAKQNKIYRIEVEHVKYPSATATTYVPKSVHIERLDTFTKYPQDMYSMPQLIQQLVFTDDANAENYYCLYAVGDYYQKSYNYYNGTYTEDSTKMHGKLYIYSEDPLIDDVYIDGNYLLFTDDLFNGKKQAIEFSVSAYQYLSAKPTVVLKSISKELYLYLVSRSKSNNSYNDPFSEPIMVYGNIKNGLGVLGSSTAASREANIKN